MYVTNLVAIILSEANVLYLTDVGLLPDSTIAEVNATEGLTDLLKTNIRFFQKRKPNGSVTLA